MVESLVPSADWTSYCQLLHQLISGNGRRNTFTQWEMKLLLDVQMSHMRKSSRSDLLRRYLKAVERQMASGATAPLRFSRFLEDELPPRKAGEQVALPRAS